MFKNTLDNHITYPNFGTPYGHDSISKTIAIDGVNLSNCDFYALYSTCRKHSKFHHWFYEENIIFNSKVQ